MYELSVNALVISEYVGEDQGQASLPHIWETYGWRLLVRIRDWSLIQSVVSIVNSTTEISGIL